MRRVLVWVGVMALLIAALAAAAQAAPRLVAHPVSISINGQPHHFSPPPLIIHGRAYVPLRPVAQSLGDTVAWDKSTLTARVQNHQQVSVQLTNRMAQVGSRSVTLAAAPMLIEDRVYVPADFLRDALGVAVAWDRSERMVDIASIGPAVAGYRSRPQALPPAAPQAAPVAPQPRVTVPAPPQAGYCAPLPQAAPYRPLPQAQAPVLPEGQAVQPMAVTAPVVKVTLEEYKVTLDPTEVPAGPVTLQVYNAGKHKHGLDIESTNIKSGLLEPGHSTTLTVDLSKPGTYTLYCPVDAHRSLGMKARLVVK